MNLQLPTPLRAWILLGVVMLVAVNIPALAVDSHASYHQNPVSLKTPTGVLHGTLEIPTGRPPYPLAIIIAGSGPTDRNGNDKKLSLNTDSYQLLAQALAANGIASLRYDKRGVAASALAAPPEQDMRFDIFVRDAEGWGRKYRHNRDFSSLTYIGHSEGSLIGMIAARKVRAQGFISLEGAGEPIQKVLLTQLREQLPPSLYKKAAAIVRKLANGRRTATIPTSLNVLFRPAIQPFLISWMRYSPTVEIAKLRIPVLIVQGGRDLQVGEIDAKRLKNANPRAQMVLIPKMNHVLKDVGPTLGDNIKAYRDPKLPLAHRLVTVVTKYIHVLHTR